MSELKDKEKKGLGYFLGIGEVFGYFFRKKDPHRKSNFNLKAMHTVNKFSIIVFILGMLFFIFKLTFLR